LVVDDDAETRAVLLNLLERADFSVLQAVDGNEALRLVEQQVPDMVILEVAIPGVTGYALCRLLRGRFGEGLPIILVSGDRVESLDRTAGLLLGADDYIVKPFDPDELLARVQRLVARSTATQVASAGREGAHRRHSDLTPRESEIMKLLVDGLNQAEIAQLLVISSNTVATHIQRILMKLGVRNRAQAVAYAAREGLVPLNSTESLESALDVSRRRALPRRRP
jgi:DNA-binding NarL/FixJ family response regulator